MTAADAAAGRPLRIGSGAGYAGDRWEPALELVERGGIDVLVFECLAERTIAREALSRRNDQSAGYNPLLAERIRSVLPAARARGVRIVSNMGAANPEAAAEAVTAIARAEGLAGTRVAALLGDDVLHWVLAHPDLTFLETGDRLGDVAGRIVSANAYLGADAILQALGTGADVVITGRVADPALFLAPAMAAHGWAADDPRLGQGCAMGHLMECAGQITGGYFADPGIAGGLKDVPEPWSLGFPHADIWADGRVRIGKVAGSGGRIDRMTCTEQLLYELHDPAAYVTPDCVLDVTEVDFIQVAPDLVEVTGARAAPRPAELKVSVGYLEGWIGEGQLSYAGINAEARARLAGEIVRRRLEGRGLRYDDLRVELIGMESLHGPGRDRPSPYEVRLRVAGRTGEPQAAAIVGQEVETLLTNGPAGGSGDFKAVREILRVQSVLIPRSEIRTQVKVFTA